MIGKPLSAIGAFLVGISLTDLTPVTLYSCGRGDSMGRLPAPFIWLGFKAMGVLAERCG
jgi:hypothetical protein